MYFSYSLSNSDVPFDIDPTTGEIRTNRLIDFEEKKSFMLNVIGTSVTGLVGSGQVEIKVQDSNDNAPRPATSLLVKFCVNNQSWTNR